VIVADWSGAAHWNRGRQACIHCGRLTMLLDDAARPAHKVCGQSALAALLGLQPDKEPGTRQAGSFEKGSPAPYPPCKLCGHPLWAPHSQQCGICEGCWIHPDEDAVRERVATIEAYRAQCAKAAP
jgi:hypothetical protein